MHSIYTLAAGPIICSQELFLLVKKLSAMANKNSKESISVIYEDYDIIIFNSQLIQCHTQVIILYDTAQLESFARRY